MNYKQAIIIRADLKLPKGKAVAQGAHAAVEAALRSEKSDVSMWRAQGQMKIALKVADQKELLRLNQMAKDMGLVTATITDAGRTCIAPGTMTCAAIGPAPEDDIDAVVKDLKLY